MATGSIILPIAAYMPVGATSFPVPYWNANRISLAYDDTTQEFAYWQFRMPSNYSNSPILKIQYKMASATSGNVVVRGSVMAVSDGDAAAVDTDSFDTANSATKAVPGTADYLDEISITLTNNDSLAAGDYTIIRVDRDAGNGSDTATGDMRIVNITLEYTTA